MKTIKIIELLNKIANKEKVPKKIKWGSHIFEWYVYEYRSEDGENDMCEITGNTSYSLNDEVEILDEEDEFEDIEEKDVYIKLCGSNWKSGQEVDLIDNLTRFNLAINKIIRNQKKIIERLKDE